MLLHHESVKWLQLAVVYPLLAQIYLVLVFYHKFRALIGYATHYLFCDSE